MTLADACERLLEIDLIHTEQLRSHRRKKLGAFDTRVLQRASLLGVERVHLFTDHRTHTLRRSEIHLRQPPHTRPEPSDLREITALAEVLKKIRSKKRMTFGLFVNQCRKLIGKIIRRECYIDILRNMLARPQSQRH